MKLYSYVVPRDYGFAPNPFYGFCTLATCKPVIRKVAKVGDWVIGTGAKPSNTVDYLIFAMKIGEALSFDNYWTDPRFSVKKPVMNGSRKQIYGDNIYHSNSVGKWTQEDSHHSYEGGVLNPKNLERDTRTNRVLISSHFYYFGVNAIHIPEKFRSGSEDIRKEGPAHKCNFEDEFVLEFLNWLEAENESGVHGDPLLFRDFERYPG